MLISKQFFIFVFVILKKCQSQNYESHSGEYGQVDYTPYFSGAQTSNIRNENTFFPPSDFNFGFIPAASTQVKNQNGFVNPNEFQPQVQPTAFQNVVTHPLGAPQNFESFFPIVAPSYKNVKTIAPVKKSRDELEDLASYEEKDDGSEEDDSGSEPKLTYKPSKYAESRPRSTKNSVDKGPYKSLAKKLPYVARSQQTPYEKFSFQPVGNLKSASFEQIRSTPIPYKAEASNANAQKEKNCRKINKQVPREGYIHGRFRRDAEKMNCYVCQDPKSGGTYEQCSYTSDPEDSDDFFVGHASKYSTQGYPDEYRSKRSPGNPLKDLPDGEGEIWQTFQNFLEESRTKRSPKKPRQKPAEDTGDEEDYRNPFDEEKSASHTYSAQPDDFGSEYYKTPDFAEFKEDYKFGPEYFTDSTNQEKSFSEQQAEELQKDPGNCQKVKKDGLTCMVCKNPKTGGNYEQCSYASEPEEKRYAYVKEKKYNSNDDPENDNDNDEESETQEKPVKTPKQNSGNYKKASRTQNPGYSKPQNSRTPKKSSSYEEFPPAPSASTGRNPQYGRKASRNQKPAQKANYEPLGSYEVFHPASSDKKVKAFPENYEERSGERPEAEENSGERGPQNYEALGSYEVFHPSKKPSNYTGLNPEIYGENSEESKDHVRRLFPDYAESEGQIQASKRDSKNPTYQYSSDLPEYFTAEESRKDVDSVLAEFAKKDRSKCKKIVKNQMTCYICADAQGVNHEECMFVSESAPKKSHLAYHEVKEFSTDPESSGTENLKVITTKSPESPSKNLDPTTATYPENLRPTKKSSPRAKNGKLNSKPYSTPVNSQENDYQTSENRLRTSPIPSPTNRDLQANSKTRRKLQKEASELSDLQGNDPRDSENRKSSQKVEFGVPSTQGTFAKSNSETSKNRRILQNAETPDLKVFSTPVTKVASTSTKVPRILRRNTNLNREIFEEVRQKRSVDDDDNENVKSDSDSDNVKNGNVKSDSSRTDEGLDEIKEVEIENSDGAYASELVPVFSKKFGTTLPKFMVDISEHEKIHDEVVASGP